MTSRCGLGREIFEGRAHEASVRPMHVSRHKVVSNEAKPKGSSQYDDFEDDVLVTE